MIMALDQVLLVFFLVQYVTSVLSMVQSAIFCFCFSHAENDVCSRKVTFFFIYCFCKYIAQLFYLGAYMFSLFIIV